MRLPGRFWSGPWQQVFDAISRLEERLEMAATRAEIDALKAQLMQTITEATTRITTDIQALRNQVMTGTPVTDADLADLQADINAVAAIDPAPVPTPAPPKP
jgi:regulator of replication initiation timing